MDEKTQNPKKFLFVSFDGLIGDIAWQIQKEGHECKYYIKSSDDEEVADGFVPKTENWKSEVDWADIIVFDDVLGMGKMAEEMRSKGKLVIGGSQYTDRLEDDRTFGQEELKQRGVNIIPYWDFTAFDDAINFVKEHPGKYVIKPSGEAQNIKGLLFIGEEEDGRDVLQVLQDYKEAWEKKIPSFQLQKRIMGVEIAVSAFFNGKNFIYPINVNLEHKKLFPGNLGPSTGEMGCYDDQTEVLTDNGWKLFKELAHEDTICTLNPTTKEIEYHAPSLVVSFSHHKKLLTIKNQTLDIAVTLDHNMYVCSQQNARKKRNAFSFVKAHSLEHQSLLKRTGRWIAPSQDYFTLPSIELGHYEGRQVVYNSSKEIKIPMDDWVAFMGIWLADGSQSANAVSISQKVPQKTKKIQDLLEKLPFKTSKSGHSFYIYSKQLSGHLKSFGKAADKHVPQYIKNLSKEQIEIFLDWFCLGDGTIMPSKHRIFYTLSKKLADDVQELLLKIGRVGIVKPRNPRGKLWIVDHYATSRNVHYEVHERVKKLDSWIDKRDMEIVNYNGKVYCATVKNHIMYVRKNGKPYWCGNTAVFWSSPNNIFNQTLKKFEEKLAEEKYCGVIDINCIVNQNGIYPLEWTSRFGYPIASIMQESMSTPLGDFLYDLAQGKDVDLKVKSGFHIGVRLVVPPFPFKDKETFNVKSKDSVVYFKNKQKTEGIHIEDVKLVNNEWLVTGKSGVVLIVCGSGQTMKAAQSQCYKRIKNINIPHMYYRTDIGDRWYEDSDRLHNWGYLREQ